MFYSGIDQHKRDSFITTYGPDGEVVKQAQLDPLGLQEVGEPVPAAGRPPL